MIVSKNFSSPGGPFKKGLAVIEFLLTSVIGSIDEFYKALKGTLGYANVLKMSE